MTTETNAMFDTAPMAAMHLNYLHVLACGVLNFLIGGFWYSDYGFSKAWTKAARHKPGKVASSTMTLLFAGWIAMSLAVALSMAYLLDRKSVV